MAIFPFSIRTAEGYTEDVGDNYISANADALVLRHGWSCKTAFI